MGRHSLKYPKDAINTVKRKNERGEYTLEKIHELVNASHLVHVSMTVPDSPFPVTIPMIGQMGSFERPSASLGDPLDLYLHGHTSSRMFSGSGGQDKTETQTRPVCVSVAHADGLVLSLSPFNSSYNYRSAVLYGHASPVSDPAEKLYALELITDGVVPGRWAHSRQPPTAAELRTTAVLRIRIASASFKSRDGSANDDRHDLEDETAMDRIWTGVVPIHQVFGEPVPSPYNRVTDAPAYIADFARDLTARNAEYAASAIQADKERSK